MLKWLFCSDIFHMQTTCAIVCWTLQNTSSRVSLQCQTHSSWWSSCWQHLMPYWSFWGIQLHSVSGCLLLWVAENTCTVKELVTFWGLVLQASNVWKNPAQNKSEFHWLLGFKTSFHIFKYPHLLSPRIHGHQDLVVTMGETLLSEDTCTQSIMAAQRCVQKYDFNRPCGFV